MRPSRGLHLDYVSPAEFQTAGWPDVLGVAAFDGAAAASPGPAAGEIPVARVNTPMLSAGAALYEVWRCGESAESGQRERVRFRRTEEMLFGCISVTEETTRTVGDGAHSPLHQATTQAYRAICATIDAEDYPHLLRVWNYLPDINRASHASRQRAGGVRARRRARQPAAGVFPRRPHCAGIRGKPAPGECLSLPAAVRRAQPGVLARYAAASAGRRDAVHLRHREHRRTPLAARRRRRGTDPRDARQHRGAARGGEPPGARGALLT